MLFHSSRAHTRTTLSTYKDFADSPALSRTTYHVSRYLGTLKCTCALHIRVCTIQSSVILSCVVLYHLQCSTYSTLYFQYRRSSVLRPTCWSHAILPNWGVQWSPDMPTPGGPRESCRYIRSVLHSRHRKVGPEKVVHVWRLSVRSTSIYLEITVKTLYNFLLEQLTATVKISRRVLLLKRNDSKGTCKLRACMLLLLLYVHVRVFSRLERQV